MNRLTEKEKTFVAEYIDNGGNGTQAALVAYDTTSVTTAASIATENLRKPKIVDVLEEALPDHLLASVHREGLFASKPHWEEVDGEYENVGEEPDFAVRAKYLDMAYKIKGSYAPEKRATLNITTVVEPSDRIKELTKKLNK